MPFLFFVLLFLCLASCDKEKAILQDPPMSVSMDLKINHPNLQRSTTIDKQWVTPVYDDWNPTGETWRQLPDGSVELYKHLQCTVTKPEGTEITLEFYLASQETAPELLQLSEPTWDNSGRRWSYLDPQDEEDRFYRALTRSRFDINGHMQISQQDDEPGLDVRSVRQAIVEGDTVSYVSLRFSGTLRGAYDPRGEYGEFTVTNGKFSGVIE